MKILAVITSIVLMLTSIWCFANSGTVFLNIAFVLGWVMVFAGVMSIFVYFFAPGKRNGFGWFFAEGITTMILGIIVLSNQLATDSMVPLFFGMWVLFCGVMRMVAALHLVLEKSISWIATLAFGFLSTIAGIYAFFNQIAAGFSIIILTGAAFLLQGINVLVYGIFIPGKKKGKKHDGIERQQQQL